MKDSGLDGPESAATRAQGHVNQVDGTVNALERNHLGDAGAAGGIYSTVRDLFLSDQALEKGSLLGHRVTEEAFTPVLLNSGVPAPYGYGWMINEFRGLKEVSHGGDIPGDNAGFCRYPSERFTVIVLSNCGMRPPGPLPTAMDLARRVVEVYLSDSLEPLREEVPFQVPLEVLNRYVGRYRLEAPAAIVAEAGKYFIVTVDGDRLYGESKGGRVPLLADSPTEFHPAGFPAKIVFLEGKNGETDELLFTLMGLRQFKAVRVGPLAD